MAKRLLMAAAISAVLGACTSARDPHSLLNDIDERGGGTNTQMAEEHTAKRAYQPADPEFYKNAYEQGVRDTMNEYKSRMRAREQYVFEPPLVQRVWMPARVVGGTFYPGHYAPVIVAPGQWVQENGVPSPPVKQPASNPRIDE